MTLAIMQPYIFPYIGYYQLINAVDRFVIYDDIEYTKKGWINRNRILLNGTDHLFTLPLKKDSDFLTVKERTLADDFPAQVKKLKGQLVAAYAKSPQFKAVYPLIEACLNYADSNLFNYIFHSVQQVCHYLELQTEFVISSTLKCHKQFKGEDKVIAINKELGASVYVNAIGGRELYSQERFAEESIELKFIQTGSIEYPQCGKPFVPWLSIIDVLMFNEKERVQELVNRYTLI